MPFEKPPSERTLEAIYNISSHAKKYAKLADENYSKRNKASARANSIKKKALYSVKSKVLNQYLPYIDDFACHRIDGKDYACLYFEGPEHMWSYHQPAGKIHQPWLPECYEISDFEPLGDFESTEEKEHSDMALKEALMHLEKLGYSANDHLEDKYVSWGAQSHFVGWKYLD